jgi:hypothetical protein
MNAHVPMITAQAGPEGLPRPLRTASPYAAILAIAAAFTGRHDVPEGWGLALGAAALAAGIGAWVWSWARRGWLCDRADRWIAAGAGQAPPEAVIEERRRELLRQRERRMLAGSIRRLVAFAQEGPRPAQRTARVPVNRPAVCAERARLERVAALLADRERAVPARSVARTHILVTDARSPLYRSSPAGTEELHRHLVQTLFELERGV